jgi:hypothetical protein
MAKLLKSLLLFTEWSLDRNHHTLHLRANRAAQQKGKANVSIDTSAPIFSLVARIKIKERGKLLSFYFGDIETWLVFEMQDGFCFKLFHPMDQSVWASRGPEASSTCTGYIMVIL